MSVLKSTTLAAAVAVVGGLAASAQAAVIVSFVAANNIAGGTTTFDGTPAVTTTNNTNSTAIPNNTTSSVPISGSAGTAASKFVGQTFTTGANGFTLDKLSFLISGPTSNGSTINLFAVTTGGTGASQTVTPAATGLLGAGGAGLTIASGTPTGGTNIETLDFTDADEITLAANTTYYAEIGGGTAGDFFIVRGQDVYTGGNAYLSTTGTGSRGTIFGGGVRDAAFAVYATVPEPASLTTLALGGLAVLRRRRA